MALQGASQEHQQALTRQVNSWETRSRAALTLRGLPLALAAGLGVSLAVDVFARVRPSLLPNTLIAITFALLLAALVLWLAWVWLRPRSTILAARHFDVLFDLKERVSTALELLDGRISTTDELFERQISEARAHADAVRPSDRLPFAARPSDWLGVLLIGALAAILILYPNPQAEAVAAENAQSAAIEAAADDLRDIAQDVAANPALPDIDRENLLRALETSIDTLEQRPLSAEEAFAAISDSQSALQNQAERFNQQLSTSAAAFDSAAEILNDLENVESESDDAEQAMQEMLDQLGQQMQSMSPQQQQAASNALNQAAQSMQGTNPQAAQQMQQAASQLQQGNAQQAQQSAQQASQSVQQGQQSQQAQQQGAQQMQQAADQAQQAGQQVAQQAQQNQQGQPQQGQQSNQPAQQPGQGEQQPGEGQPSEQQGGESDSNQPGQPSEQGGQPGQSGQQQPGESGQQPGQVGSGEQPGTGQQQSNAETSGTGGGAGDQAGGAGSDDPAGEGQSTAPEGGNSPDGEGVREYAPVYAPRLLDAAPGTDEMVLEQNDGSSSPIVSGEFAQNPAGSQQVPYNQVYTDYANQANRALESDYIPLGLRDVVRDYFTALEPGQNSGP